MKLSKKQKIGIGILAAAGFGLVAYKKLKGGSIEMPGNTSSLIPEGVLSSPQAQQLYDVIKSGINSGSGFRNHKNELITVDQFKTMAASSNRNLETQARTIAYSFASKGLTLSGLRGLGNYALTQPSDMLG